MARLILLNGPPGAGKSTIAQRYAHKHPLVLILDLDLVRRSLGDWRSHPEESGQLARRLAAVMCASHLASGRDVVVAQYLGRAEFIEVLENVAKTAESSFREVVLLASRETVVARFEARTAAAAHPSHAEAQEMTDAALGGESLAMMYNRLIQLLPARPKVEVLDTEGQSIDQTYQALILLLSNVESGE